MFLSRDGDVKYYSLFSVLHDRFVRDDCQNKYSFWGRMISAFNWLVKQSMTLNSLGACGRAFHSLITDRKTN